MMFDKSLYTIGWVCALEAELVAAKLHLDEKHAPDDYKKMPHDNNTYAFGSIGKHNVVIAALPNGVYGNNNAASVARDMIRSFTNVRIGLMVGIGGGAPLMGPGDKQKRDIRLGDVVVSIPHNGRGGVLQYDFGKQIQKQQFKMTGHLNSPPHSILSAVAQLGADFVSDGNTINQDIELLLDRSKRLQRRFGRPDQATDLLYQSSFLHENDDENCAESCNQTEYLIHRDVRDEDEDEDIVAIHRGTIASANQLVKDASLRDRLAKQEDVLCFEMEAGGLMNQFPFLVIRGICDYSDTHRNKAWQDYAAMTAAAYTRKLLLKLHPEEISNEIRMSEIEEHLQEMGSDLRNIQSNLKQHAERSLAANVVQWLAAPNPETNFRSATDQREPGTGQWLTNSEVYSRWKAGTIRHLWLYGKAGCGKSVISASIIEDVRKHCANNIEAGHAFFYFTFSDSSKQSYIDCLRSVMHQLSRNQSVSSSLEQLFKSGQHSSPKEEDLQAILFSGIRSYKTFFLILDALDESPEEIDGGGTRQRDKLLDWLQAISNELPFLQILATSRRLPDIEARLNEMNFHQQSMITDCVNEDISSYVVGQLSKDRRLCQLDNNMIEKIQDAFMENADGMFRWAFCQMNELKSLRSTRPSDLERVLRKLPASLDETYDRMISRISETSHADVLALLRWLTYSCRPMTLLELSEARIIDLDAADGVVTFRDRGRPEDILELLSDFILVGKSEFSEYKDGTGEFDNADDRADQTVSNDKSSHRSVRLAHFSIQEYLKTSRISTKGRVSFCFQTTREHQILSQSCVLYLTRSAASKMITKTLQDLANFPLLNYAATYWFIHCRKTENVDRELQFLSSEACLYSLEIYNTEYPWSEPFFGETAGLPLVNPLYYAALNGLTKIVTKLLEARVEANAQGGMYGNALQAATVYGGNDSVVKMLLDAGADVNAQGGMHGNALQAAAVSKGNDSIVKMLLEAGADANAQGGMYGNALQAAAARSGNESMIKILLDAGADVNLLDSAQWTAIIRNAFRAGNLKLFNQLVATGRCDLDIRSRTLMDCICASGNIEILEAYLRVKEYNTSEINPSSAWSPLHWACRSGSFEMLKLLYNIGVRPRTVETSQPAAKWTPLDVAIYYNNGNLFSAGKLIQDYDWHSVWQSEEADITSVSEHGGLPVYRGNSLRPAGKAFNGYCNGCFSDIIGLRFKCQVCEDFDYCFMCKLGSEDMHPGHGWDRMNLGNKSSESDS